MDVLYLLVPLSVVLVFLIIGLFAWALHAGQFDSLEHEGQKILSSETEHTEHTEHTENTEHTQPANPPDGLSGR